MSGSIVTQIETHEAKLREAEEILERVEKQLRLFDISDEERKSLEKEQAKVQKDIENHKSELKSLRFENFKTGIISFVVMFVIYAIYSAYTMDQPLQETAAT